MEVEIHALVRFTLRLLYTWGKGPRYPLDRTLDGPQTQSGRGGEEKNPIIAPSLYTD